MTNEEINKHYEHKCNTGFDPLLCVHLTYYADGVNNDPKRNRHRYFFIDKIITPERYLELIKTTNSTIDDLTDMDIIDVKNTWLPMEHANEEEAAIFWLKPTSKCKTLSDLYSVYEARIKIMFNKGGK